MYKTMPMLQFALRPSMMVKRLPLADSKFFRKSPPAKTETLFKK